MREEKNQSLFLSIFLRIYIFYYRVKMGTKKKRRITETKRKIKLKKKKMQERQRYEDNGLLLPGHSLLIILVSLCLSVYLCVCTSHSLDLVFRSSYFVYFIFLAVRDTMFAANRVYA